MFLLFIHNLVISCVVPTLNIRAGYGGYTSEQHTRLETHTDTSACAVESKHTDKVGIKRFYM